jgi:two-component system, cell cycle sensor histidine kinase and response regulator CckA
VAQRGILRPTNAERRPPASTSAAIDALQASEIRYRRLFEAARDGILMLDARTGEITAVNPFLAQLLGYTESAILGKKLWEISPFEDIKKSKVAFKELQAQEYIRYDDLPLETRDGRSIAVEFVSNMYMSGEEEVIQCNIRDITERKQRRRAQQSSDECYRALFDYAPDGIVISDRTSCVLDANASVCRMLGYTRDEIVGKHGSDIVIPAEIEHIETALATIVGTANHHREWQFRRKDGSAFTADVMATTMPDGNLMAMVRDVTARNRLDEALRSTEDRMRFALQNADVGIWNMDFTSGVLEWSDIMERQYSLSPGTFGGTWEAFIDCIHPDDRTSVLDVVQHAVTTGTDFSVVHRTNPSNGTVRWLSGAGRTLLDEHGKALRAVGISQDVTERHTLEAQFQQAQKMEAVGRLAGGVAHDFNNLLTVILGFCELLLTDAAPGDPRSADILEIRKAGTRATELTRQLLAFSRKEIIEPTLLDLGVILNDMRPMLGRLIREDIKILVGARPGLARVKVDRGQMEQVIVNLAVNAQDAMANGGTLTIEVANVFLDEHYAAVHFDVKPGPYVVLTVTDSGTGMAADVRERVFEPFFTTKPVGQGTGLGLATVHGIVMRGGGSVSVYSEVGRGTSFKVYLPHAAAAELEVAASSAVPVMVTGAETVLVVEDAEGLRELTKRLLEKLGYTVLVAANVDEAIHRFEENPSIDVLLTDVVMPGPSGPELTKRLIERRPGLKVIYMSGYTDEAIVQHGVLKPGIAFLHKPFTSDALGRKVRSVLDDPAPLQHTERSSR